LEHNNRLLLLQHQLALFHLELNLLHQQLVDLERLPHQQSVDLEHPQLDLEHNNLPVQLLDHLHLEHKLTTHLLSQQDLEQEHLAVLLVLVDLIQQLNHILVVDLEQQTLLADLEQRILLVYLAINHRLVVDSDNLNSNNNKWEQQLLLLLLLYKKKSGKILH
jgi:hypothetical protein